VHTCDMSKPCRCRDKSSTGASLGGSRVGLGTLSNDWDSPHSYHYVILWAPYGVKG